MSLVAAMGDKAIALNVPLAVHLDITYRCNERCVHCYLDHDDHGELSTAEIKRILDQLAAAGTFFLTLSGGEVLMRRDFFDILEYARSWQFAVKLKTNGVMIREDHARRMRQLGVQEIQISIYSDRAEVHDAITKLPGSLRRSLDAVRLLKRQGLRVTIANVLMTANMFDDRGVIGLAKELGTSYTLDPMVTPKIDGDVSTLAFRAPASALQSVFHDPELVGDVEQLCSPPPPLPEDVGEDLPCSAGHASCYISPYGDVFPCVQFPLPCGNLRTQSFLEVWQNSQALAEVRSIQVKDLPTCSSCAHAASCSRCPGLAYMEGNMRGPSTSDCQQSYVRTGVPTGNMLRKEQVISSGSLVQIRAAGVSPYPRS
jgi:radical SAM protein with 4Fe4S-binding SPASM domain